MKFVFFGTTEFSVKVLEILHQNNFIPELIITTPDKPKGRGLKLQHNPVKIWAEKNNIKVIQPEKLEIRNLKLEIGKKNINFNIIAAYGKILPKEIINTPTLNVHPSLLPKLRGPSPIQSFILSGEEKTGVTIMLTDEQIDHGAILAQRELEVSNLYYKDLEEKLAELGGNLLIETIPKFINGEIKPQEQNHAEATFTKKITKQDGEINLEKDAPEIIERKVRALTPWPGAYTIIDNKRLLILEAKIKDGQLKIIKVKPESKNEMIFEDYLRGNPNSNFSHFEN